MTMNIQFFKSKKFYIGAAGILAGLILISLISVSLVKLTKSNAQKTLNAGFYNLDEKMTKVIEENIKKSEIAKVNFKNLTLEELKNGKIYNNYDLIFTWDGITASNLKTKGANFSGRIYNLIPTSMRRENEENDRRALPLLLDHFEFSYNRNVSQKIGQENPQTFEDFLKYLDAAKKYTFTPFFTNGGDDEILLGLISCMIESKGGYDAYSDFVKQVRKNPNFEKIAGLKLGKSGSVSMEEILNLFRSWQENGIVHPNWYNAKYRDIIAFIEDGQVSVLFTKLSVHRTIPYKLIRDFSTERAPVAAGSADHAVIAPAICAVKLSHKSLCDRLLQSLLSEDFQGSLSMGSQLGPVALRGESFDLQADDARFFAASCRYGSRAGIYLDAFTPASESCKKLCQGIRHYLTTGRYQADF